MRIKYIVPFPFGASGLAKRAGQIPLAHLSPGTEVTCVAVRNSTDAGGSYYDTMLFDMYVTEAGLTAEDEGYNAVIMDTMTDSGLNALRARLTIPVIGPGLVAYTIAMILGKRFSIITMTDSMKFPLREDAGFVPFVGQMCLDTCGQRTVRFREPVRWPRSVDIPETDTVSRTSSGRGWRGRHCPRVHDDVPSRRLHEQAPQRPCDKSRSGRH